MEHFAIIKAHALITHETCNLFMIHNDILKLPKLSRSGVSVKNKQGLQVCDVLGGDYQENDNCYAC